MNRDFKTLSIKREQGQLSIIDQTQLPHSENWILVNSLEVAIECIKHLKVRGAPLIGVLAAQCLSDEAKKLNREEFIQSALKIRESRPTAVNLMFAVDAVIRAAKEDYKTSTIEKISDDILHEDQRLCDQISENGNQLIESGDRILTHCNTGGLATAGVGTAFGVIRKAHESGKNIHVYVDETRPLLQGGRLTTWELEKLKIPYTLICDNMAGHLMSKGQISKSIVGADRIATNGDFANKIGTYSVAALCHLHNIPFYVAAPYTTVDQECGSGVDIPIEQRKSAEVQGVSGAMGELKWAPESSEVYNPAFDVTPAKYVSSWILNDKNYYLNEIQQGKLKSV